MKYKPKKNARPLNLFNLIQESGIKKEEAIKYGKSFMQRIKS